MPIISRVLSIGLMCLLIACGGHLDSRRPTSEVIQRAEGAEDSPPYDGGKAFLAELASAVRQSSRVVVVEHSNRFDSMTNEGNLGAVPDQIYRTVSLSSEQKSRFLKMLQATKLSSDLSGSACVFEPHHRVEFYQGARLVNALEVCLQCGQEEWDGSRNLEPTAFYGQFADFVQSIGMRPAADWHALRLKPPNGA